MLIFGFKRDDFSPQTGSYLITNKNFKSKPLPNQIPLAVNA